MLSFLIALTYASIPKDPFIFHLQKPLQSRIEHFQNKEAELLSYTINKKNNFKARWMAYATLVELKPTVKNIELGLKSYEWFLKDLGLKLAQKYNLRLARKWARVHLTDPSLIVRTTAVKVLRSLNDITSREKLWQELYAEKNFRKNQSLWVRRHIANTLAYMVNVRDKKVWSTRMVKILQDTDSRLHEGAIQGLSRIYDKGPKFYKEEPVSIKKMKWLAWLKN